MLLSQLPILFVFVFAAPCIALSLPFSARSRINARVPNLSEAQLEELRRTNSITQVPAGKALHPFEKIHNDIVRWRGTAPAHILEARDKALADGVLATSATKKHNGTVQSADVPGDSEFLTPIKVGAKTFNVVLDSGSSNLWVFSTQLPTSERGTGHNLYNLTGVKYTNPAETWDISYGDGSAADGNLYLDNLTIGGLKQPIAVGAATSLSSRFVNAQQDGILGLGFDSGNTCQPYPALTFMTVVNAQLEKPLFTSTLRKGKAGTFDFGFVDPNKYTGSIGFVKSDNSSAYWGLTPGGYAVGSGSKITYAFDTIADTGTSLLYVPSAIINGYYSKVKGAFKKSSDQFVYFPCSSTLPNFSLYIGSHKATVPGSYLNALQLNSTTCLGGMQDAGHIGANIIGIAFLKSQFVVYDLDLPRLGFAQQKGLPSS